MLVVVAIGGNAIAAGGRSVGTVGEQRGAVRHATAGLAELVAQGHRLVLTHGNGPQVGALLLQQRASRDLPAMPLDVLVAQTQGLLGYLLAQQLASTLRERGITREVVTLLTQVVVDRGDPAFATPDKPVGPTYTATELEHLTGIAPPPSGTPHTVDGAVYGLVPGGWRRVVASPQPLDVVEIGAIAAVVERGGVPVCAGGGGVPVTREAGALCGVEAVIDKDRTAALLTRLLGADALLILTDVDRVRLGFGTPSERPVECMTPEEASGHLAAGEFPPGSMGPKVASALDVATRGGLAMIGSLSDALGVLEGRSGTRIDGR